MLLEAPPLALLASSSSVSLPAGVAGGARFRFPCSYLKLTKGERRRGPVLAAAEGSQAITGVVFQPFEELKRIEASLVPIALDQSLARQKYTDDCEAAINVQINVEYNVSYVYHALFAYFDRDNVALNGLAKFFKESSDEEREHAEKFIKYQNKRGGRAKLLPIVTPPTEFDHAEKGDALYGKDDGVYFGYIGLVDLFKDLDLHYLCIGSMELALALEKLTNEKLLQLHTVAQNSNDPQLTDFIESEFLEEQVETIKNVAEYVAQLRRVGKGHGVWHFDQMLLHEGDAA